MQNFELTILGCSSATPTATRNPTAQLLNIAERFFLIDCGEGTQMQIRRYKLKMQRISHIFISHLHGDHYLGLMGLLSSMHLLGRTTELHLYCPPPLQEIIELQYKHSQTYLNFRIIYHPHSFVNNDVLFEDEKVIVRSIELNHRIPCCGFRFDEKPTPKSVRPSAISEYGLNLAQILAAKRGENIQLKDGRTIPNEHITREQMKPRSYAFCSDTKYDERLLEVITGVDLLYHEATFLHEKLDRAKETFHTTALQAGEMAKKANAGKLMIGHYSARYKDLEPLRAEAASVFPETILAVEGEKTKL